MCLTTIGERNGRDAARHLAGVFALALGLLACGTHAYGAPLDADGCFAPGEEYNVIYEVCFPNAEQDGSRSGWVGATGVGVGLLALGTDPGTGNHHMYYALPKGYVDNTYNSEVNDSVPPTVGTYVGGDGHKIGTGLIGSDQFGISGNVFELYVTDPGNVLPAGDKPFRMTVDYLADVITSGTRTDLMSSGIKGVNDPLPPGATQWQRRDGSMNRGDDAYVLQIATSMECNLDRYGPTGTGDITAADITTLSGYLAKSPDVVRDTGGPDPTLAVLAGDGYSYQPLDPTFADWVYEVAYEFEFDAALFGPEWADPSTLVTSLLKLGGTHASPYKGLLGQKDLGEPCFNHQDDDEETRLTVVKEVVGGVPDDDWQFELFGPDGGSLGPFSIAATGGSVSFVDTELDPSQLPGVYTVQELNPQPYPWVASETEISILIAQGDDWTMVFTNTLVPEPSSVALIGLGLLGLVRRRRRK